MIICKMTILTWIVLLVFCYQYHNVCFVHARAFDVDLLHIAQHFKIPIAEVAVNWQEVEGKSPSLY